MRFKHNSGPDQKVGMSRDRVKGAKTFLLGKFYFKIDLKVRELKKNGVQMELGPLTIGKHICQYG